MRRRARTQVPRTVPPGQLRRTLEAIRRFRMHFVFGTLMVLFLLLLVRLGKLQLVDGERYREAAADRHESRYKFPRMRGRILDRFGWPLATSLPMRTVAIDPHPDVVRDPWSFSLQVSALLGGDPAAHEIRTKISRVRAKARTGAKGISRYVVLRRKVEDPLLIDRLDTVAAMGAREKVRVGLYGLIVDRKEIRSYPNGDYAIHTIGHVPHDDDRGRVGIEGHCHAYLSGRDARVSVRRDGRRRLMAPDGPVDRASARGGDVTLTIDLVVQHHLEEALSDLVRRHPDFHSVAGIVIDPHSGEILALSNRPLPFARPQTEAEAGVGHMNYAIQGRYEPGSIFKPFTAAWALEHGVIDATSVIPMPLQASWPNVVTVHDSHYVGAGDVVLLITQSSNTGAAWLAHGLGPKRMAGLWRRMRIGRPTGVGFRNEEPRTPPKAEDTPVALETWPEWLSHRAGYGQGFTMTPLQIACAFCAFARDDARMVKPQIVRSAVSKDCRGPRLMHPKHLAVIRRGLRGVTAEGTADDQFAFARYDAAGKTGTSLQRGRDPETRETVEYNVCTFVGYAPADDPQVVACVLAMVPRGTGSGASVSGVAVQRVFDATLAYWQVGTGERLLPSDPAESADDRGPVMAPAMHTEGRRR